MPRHKIVWTDKEYKQLEALFAIQATLSEIESVMSVDHKTLDRLCRVHYGKSMGLSECKEKYASTGKISLRRDQFKLAKKSAAMSIWLGKNVLGQTDNQRAESDVEDLSPLADLLKISEGEKDE